MSTETQVLQNRLRVVELQLDAAIQRRDSLPAATPARDEWTGIVFACLREQRHVRSDLGRARAVEECGR